MQKELKQFEGPKGEDRKVRVIVGRVYSPETGRFLSPDPLIQAPEYSQSFNRYSYVWIKMSGTFLNFTYKLKNINRFEGPLGEDRESLSNNPLNNIDPSGYALVNIWDPSGIKDKDGKRSEKCNHPDPRRCGNYFKFLSQMRLKRLMQAQQKARQACAKGLGPSCKAALAQLDAAGGLMPEGAGDDIGSCEIPKQCAQNLDPADVAHYIAERSATLVQMLNGTLVLIGQNGNIAWYNPAHANGWRVALLSAREAQNIPGIGLSTAGKFMSKTLFGVGAVLEVQDVKNGQSIGKAGLDIGVSALALLTIPTAIGGATYHGVDLFYPGGWPGYIRDGKKSAEIIIDGVEQMNEPTFHDKAFEIITNGRISTLE